MAPAPQDELSPAGSSTYSSNTLYVGDGTWDSTRNTFLLPNLQGFNLATTQYNGMGNRFASLDQYHTLIKGHAIVAVITFLFIVPAAIMIRRFSMKHGRGDKYHVYLQVMTLLLSTVVLILGWFAVGPLRSLTNPHHGIGVAIYTLIWVQMLLGWRVRSWKAKHPGRRLSIKQMLHQWLGRATALLAFAQVALGLALYGSPTWTFVLYALWMFFLVFLYFVYSYRLAGRPINEGLIYETSGQGAVIKEKKSGGGFMSFLAPIVAGGAAATLLGRRRNKSRDRDEVSSYTESRITGDRRGSYVEEERYKEKKKSGGFFDKLLLGAGALGLGALVSNQLNKRQNNRDVDEYSAVHPDTPSRRGGSRYGSRGARRDSQHYSSRHPTYEDENGEAYSVDPREVRRGSHGHGGPLLPGPGDPIAAAAAISAAEPRPVTPRSVVPRSSRVGGRGRQDSYSDLSESEFDSPSRKKTTGGDAARNAILGGLGVGWLTSKWRNRKEQKEQKRLDDIRAREEEDRRRLEYEQQRRQNRPPRNTGDDFPARMHGRRGERTESSFQTESSIVEPHEPRVRHAGPSNLGAAAAGTAAGATMTSDSRHNIVEPVPMPTSGPRPSRTDYTSDSELSDLRSSGRRQDGAPAATAAAAGATFGDGHHRSSSNVQSPPVRLHVTHHNDRAGSVTLQRLADEEAAVSRRARRHADSMSSLSNSEIASRGRYRRDESTRRPGERRAERRAEQEVEAQTATMPLEPPRPAFADGRQPDTSYYGGTPPRPTETVASPGSHGTWSELTPGPSGSAPMRTAEETKERRRQRRLERKQPSGHVEFE